MLRAKRFLLPALLAAAASGADFSGASALKFTREAVAFGPRPAGSEANRQLQAYILAQLNTCACQVIEDAFTQVLGRKVRVQCVVTEREGTTEDRAGGADSVPNEDVPDIVLKALEIFDGSKVIRKD